MSDAANHTNDPSDPAYWEAAYRERRDGWELGGPTPPLARALAAMPAAGNGRALVVGSGRGHEAREAAKRGFRVVAVDFAQSARTEAERLTPPDLAARIAWRTQDLFELPETDAGAFDLVIEHTSFCAIDRARRDEWMRVARAVLRPGGTLLALFYTHGREGGPPFGATHDEVRAALDRAGFAIATSEVPDDSIERRRGDELLVRATAP
jgi:SAM-dependent methyltransferase